MKSWMLTSLITATLLAVLTIPTELRAAPPKPKIISFDAPDAATYGLKLGTGCFGCTFSINQSGVIVGTYMDENFVFHGFERSPNGTITTIDDPEANSAAFSVSGTWAQAINDLGEITGYYQDLAGNQHGFVRSAHGSFTTFDAPDGENGTTPLFISLDGAVVGYAWDTNFLFHAFLRHANGTITDFVGPNSCTASSLLGYCYGTGASYVDFFGTTVAHFEDNSGNYVRHGLIRSPFGQLTKFDAPGAGTGLFQGTGCPGCNFGVNYLGLIAGTFIDTNYVSHGFVRNLEGKFTTFDANGAGTGFLQGTGCFSDCPVSINDFGVITGSYIDSNNVQHGYLRNPNGSFVTLDPPGSVGTQPESINDAGEIVGYYIDANSVSHGFLVQSW